MENQVHSRSVSKSVDVLVVGAGVIGLTVAWRAAAAGMSVRVIESEHVGAGATPVAAGILSPVTFGNWTGAADPINIRSMNIWQTFAEELAETGGLPVPYRCHGALHVARDASESEQFMGLVALGGQWLDADGCRELEPGLVDGLSGLFIADEAAVDTTRLIPALLRACAHAGVLISEHTQTQTLLRDENGRILGLGFSNSEREFAGTVVVAAGAWSGSLHWLPESLRPPVTPLLGEALILKSDKRVCQHIVRSLTGSLSLRGGGHYWTGTTAREVGFNNEVAVASVMSILKNHISILPALEAAALVSAQASFRPHTPDDNPVVGWAAPSLLYASGHGRKGILLAPATAAAVCDLLRGQELPADMHSFDPTRFLRTDPLSS